MTTCLQLTETCYLLVMTLALTGIFSKTRFLKGVRNLFLYLQYFIRNQLPHGGLNHLLELYKRKGYCILNTGQQDLKLITKTMLFNVT